MRSLWGRRRASSTRLFSSVLASRWVGKPVRLSDRKKNLNSRLLSSHFQHLYFGRTAGRERSSGRGNVGSPLPVDDISHLNDMSNNRQQERTLNDSHELAAFSFKIAFRREICHFRRRGLIRTINIDRSHRPIDGVDFVTLLRPAYEYKSRHSDLTDF